MYAKIRFGHFLCALALSSVICGRIHLFNAFILQVSKILIRKSLIKKIFKKRKIKKRWQ